MSTKMQWVYTEKVKDHFVNPRNVLDDEDSFGADGTGMVGSMACGDQMLVAIKVRDGKIAECRWKTYGCASAIASTSMMSEMVTGMSLEEAYHITPKQITEALGGLPEHKFHCSVLGDKGLRAAIDDYLEKNGLENPFTKSVANIVCECVGVTDQAIEAAYKAGAVSYEAIQKATGAGTVCGKCREKTEAILEEMEHLYGKNHE
ncbi:iron-sulfur cluster assembly scaffold protein [Sediminispirochaeta smaragdinae]|uniref:Nitrogen-fixing NifU domain protein n=1 Tax=Sediminispirochaeta smaragdinae (strain DSM 11293 / JCM 15392 / SEBR 4228) TaxID=573413 RepID=E1R5D9_SEDSS|nr:iron-sulfur cluster assembly scaffold protein [Sediminispirochaeta smaragdinae]ADK82267.1 nitrogen-fixing NifU domain protein [Sediminispirochaeta smaragdinae DSM 11293]